MKSTVELTGESVFEQARELHRLGDLESAIRLYEQVIDREPGHADALHLLGFAAFQSGNFDRSIQLIGQALDVRPQMGEYHTNLALALLCNGQPEPASTHITQARRLGYRASDGLLHVGVELYENGELALAKSCFELALSQTPDSAEALHFLGIVHKNSGRFDEAIECYEAAVALQPGYGEALINLGNAWRDAGLPARAIPYYRSALQLDPGVAAAHNNLGIVYLNRGELDLAIDCFNEACRLEPHSADAFNNMGNALREYGHVEEAEEWIRQALLLSPESPEILNNLGMTLRTLDRTEEGIQFLRRSVAAAPQEAKVIANLGSALVDVGQYEEATDQFRQAASRDPSQPLLPLRAGMVCPPVFPDAQSMQQTWDRMLTLCGQYAQSKIPQELGGLLDVATAPPFNAQFFSHNVRPFREAYARIFADLHNRWPQPEWELGTRERIKIGLVVTSRHEGIFLKSLSGVLERLDPERFEVLVFCSRTGIERIGQSSLRGVVELIPLPARLNLVADAIYATELDLLYYWEIGTDAMNYFLPFLRLAPIQCTSWGIQVTSGIPTIDYYLSSECVEPPDAADHYTEQLVLAKSLLCFRQRLTAACGVSPRAKFGFPDRHSIFLCAQQPGKFHPDFDPIMREILQRTEQSLLVITADPKGHSARVLTERFRRSLPDVFDRVVFLPRLEVSDYVALIQASDVLLDPPHFGGVNTTYDGLSLGKPILTCPSAYHRGRYTAGCYRQLGFTGCVAADSREYIELAVRLGSDAEFRQATNSEILAHSGRLFDDDTTVREHERIFENLVRNGPN